MSNFSIDMTPFAASQAAQGQQLAAILTAVKAIPKPAPADNGPLSAKVDALAAAVTDLPGKLPAPAAPVDLAPITARMTAMEGVVKDIADALAKLAAPAEVPDVVRVLLTFQDGTRLLGDVQRDSAERLQAARMEGATGPAQLAGAEGGAQFPIEKLENVELFEWGPAVPPDAPTRPG